ncbi:5'-phosphate oxidase [Mycobacterium marseillense]|uniref:5'-phosphate oxidase n=1 Tax=Mycobacterium marseillense TaxID=701042 RepID=A0AAC9VT05_9MYCO|nr:5'-phosphate oxidase [Mycobacterium marseillense]ASW90004.1 5'-phosphate oxidase [Mycobacterium marseillense]
MMARFKTEMEVCPHCRRSAEATVEYSYDSDGKVTGRRVRDVNCRHADCPGSEVPPHWG